MVHHDKNEEFHTLKYLEQLIGDSCLFSIQHFIT